jgi:ATP-dependent RNA helicase DeaD
MVPYPRRRRVEMMLRGAKINVEWTNPPTADDIRASDRERLVTTLLEPVEIDEEDRALAQRLIAEKSPEDIAAMLVQAHRARLPEPEELVAATPEAQRAAQADKHRPGFDDTQWFAMDIGRRQNADPRWILPLLCRRGHITRNEIGAIRIGPNETWFQVPSAIAAKFNAAVQRTASEDGEDESGIRIVPGNGPAPGGNGAPRGGGAPRTGGGPRGAPMHRARPTNPRKPQGRRP